MEPKNKMPQEGIQSQMGLTNEDIEKNIKYIDAQLELINTLNFSLNPTAKFMVALGEEMNKQGLGKYSKHVGALSIRISELFWSDEIRAKRIIKNLVSSFKKMHEFFQSEFGDGAEQIFKDNLTQTKFIA